MWLTASFWLPFWMTRDAPLVPSWATLALFNVAWTISERLLLPLWLTVARLLLAFWAMVEPLVEPGCVTEATLPLPSWLTADVLLWASAGPAVRRASVEAPARRRFFTIQFL